MKDFSCNEYKVCKTVSSPQNAGEPGAVKKLNESKANKMKTTKLEIAVLEKIAATVMKTCKRPEIRGVGHEARIRAPKNAAVFRVLAFDDFSTGRGSRCGFTAKSFVLKVVARAAKKGIVWDWDGRIAGAAAAKVACEKYHAEIAAREAAFVAAGGECAFQKWYAENPAASGNCQTEANKTARARKNFVNHLMKNACR